MYTNPSTLLVYSIARSSRMFGLGNHELGDRRSGACDNAGNLDGVILSQIQEEVPVVSICSVEFIPVKIHA